MLLNPSCAHHIIYKVKQLIAIIQLVSVIHMLYLPV